eukprot:TRINITY_DN57496_c0_g1_i1.p1 TRINITY_DN57496_c0_g1~~TRINITY_DN57496_c0_g1_i1.p1  ORF type:complete len:823 (-),score=124.26 TRINITY_DN57496_c0_g1_i1:24-2249(-)
MNADRGADAASAQWNTRANEMENAVEEVTYEFITLDAVPSPSEHKRTWISVRTAWVEDDWFLLLTAAVVVLNVLLFVIEGHSQEDQDRLQLFEVLCLVFYIIELLLRGAHYGSDFFVGSWRFVILNWVDVLVVVFSIVDQWILPSMTTGSTQHPLIAGVIRIFRVTRLLRAVRLVRLLLGADLNWAAGKRFETFIAAVIAFNAIIMGFETDLEWSGWYWVEQGLLIVFVFELVARFKVRGCREFFCGDPGGRSDAVWNWLDFIIVTSGALDQWGLPMMAQLGMSAKRGGVFGHFITLLRLFRLVRVLRLIKLVRAVKPLYLLAMGIVEAMQAMFWVMVLTMVLIYGFSILLTNLIGHGLLIAADSEDADLRAGLHAFGTVPNTMFTMFLVMNGEFQVLFPLFDVCPAFRLLFVFFEVASTWGLLAILTAVVSDNMISVASKHEAEELRDRKDSEWSRTLAEIATLVHDLDRDGNKSVDEKELANFLEQSENVERLRDVAHITKGDATEIMKSVANHGEVKLDDLIEGFAMAAQPVTEKSMLRLEARVRRGIGADLVDMRDALIALQAAHGQQMQALLQLSDTLDASQSSRTQPEPPRVDSRDNEAPSGEMQRRPSRMEATTRSSQAEVQLLSSDLSRQSGLGLIQPTIGDVEILPALKAAAAAICVRENGLEDGEILDSENAEPETDDVCCGTPKIICESQLPHEPCHGGDNGRSQAGCAEEPIGSSCLGANGSPTMLKAE